MLDLPGGEVQHGAALVVRVPRVARRVSEQKGQQTHAATARSLVRGRGATRASGGTSQSTGQHEVTEGTKMAAPRSQVYAVSTSRVKTVRIRAT